MIQLYIDNSLIPDNAILSLPNTEQSLGYGDKLIASTSEVVLDNASGMYGDMSPTSIFTGVSWFNLSYVLKDSEFDNIIFSGKIKNIVQNDSGRTVTVTAVNYMQDIFTKVCVYSATNITPADAMLAVLQYAGIPTANINLVSFAGASSLQSTNNFIIDISYTEINKIKCSDILNELCRLSQCSLFTRENVIYVYQWKPYAGEVGYEINKIVPGSFSTEYSYELFNKYSVVYKNGAGVLYSTGTAPGSTTDNTISFPDKDTKSTASADFRIICVNSTGATYAGNNAVSRMNKPKKIVSFTTSMEYNYINVGEQIDLTYGDYYKEPVDITDLNLDSKSRTIQFKGTFRNLPIEYTPRDTTLPDTTIIIAVSNVTNVYIRLADTSDPDFDHYNLYFGIDSGNMNTEMCYSGKSPLPLYYLPLDHEGYRYFRVFGLLPEVTYYFKATCVNNIGNESVFSNIVTGNTTQTRPYVTRVTSDGSVRRTSNSDMRVILNIL